MFKFYTLPSIYWVFIIVSLTIWLYTISASAVTIHIKSNDVHKTELYSMFYIITGSCGDLPRPILCLLAPALSMLMIQVCPYNSIGMESNCIHQFQISAIYFFLTLDPLIHWCSKKVTFCHHGYETITISAAIQRKGTQYLESSLLYFLIWEYTISFIPGNITGYKIW